MRGGIPRPAGDFPESLSQAVLVGIILVDMVCDLGDLNDWLLFASRGGWVTVHYRLVGPAFDGRSGVGRPWHQVVDHDTCAYVYVCVYVCACV